MSERKGGAAFALLAVPVLIIGAVFAILLVGGSAASATCNPDAPGVTVDPRQVPAGSVAGFGRDQLVNAAYIVRAGKDLQLGVRDQTIAVMTAIGESGLRVLDHGDRVGPDSRGLFQQRSRGWGSYADRMDPYISATNFFRAMQHLAQRDSLPPTIVAHRTQRNADPYYYTKYWDSAVGIVENLSGTQTGLATGTGDQSCAGSPAVPGQVSATGWAVPAAGPITSPYGKRFHPIKHVWRLHSGTDLAGGGCGGPIWAAQAGTVTFTGFDSGGNGTIRIDHGGGVQTAYLHEYASGILVHAGEHVRAGQQIARVGSSGQSTGCHMHFMVIINGSPTDPVPFMHDVGITLG